MNLEASSLDCQIDMDPVDYSLIKFAQEKLLADGPQFHYFLPNLARKSVEQKLRGGVDNNRVEIHWRSDESYSSTRLARVLDTRGLWDEEYIHLEEEEEEEQQQEEQQEEEEQQLAGGGTQEEEEQ